MTNLAEAFRADPTLAERIAMLYVMGGALDVPGNLAELTRRVPNAYAEWNMYIDPLAAAMVLDSGAPLTLVPLDVTNHHPVTGAFYQHAVGLHTTPAARFLVRLLRRMRPLLRGQPLYLWDPLAAAIALYPEIARFQTRSVRIVADEGPECGRLVADRGGTRVQVCTDVDHHAFEALVLATLSQPLGDAVCAHPGSL